jgi:hypothetical protein
LIDIGKVKNDIEFSLAAQKESKAIEEDIKKFLKDLLQKKKPEKALLFFPIRMDI